METRRLSGHQRKHPDCPRGFPDEPTGEHRGLKTGGGPDGGMVDGRKILEAQEVSLAAISAAAAAEAVAADNAAAAAAAAAVGDGMPDVAAVAAAAAAAAAGWASKGDPKAHGQTDRKDCAPTTARQPSGPSESAAGRSRKSAGCRRWSAGA